MNFKSETDCSNHQKVKQPLPDIASEDEDDEGYGNKKPINLDVDNSTKTPTKRNHSPMRNQNLRVTTLRTKTNNTIDDNSR